MKVVQAVGWYFPDTIGGTEVYVSAVARELRAAGVDVRIAAPRAGAGAVDNYEHDGALVFRYPVPERASRAEARGNVVARGSERFHDWLRTERPDVVHMHTFVTGLNLPEIDAARAAGARVFVTSHSSALGYVCLRGTLLRWGHEPCDGVVDPQRCAACALQHRGFAKPVARLLGRLPAALAAAADRVEHPLGTMIGLPAYIQQRMHRQRELFDKIEAFFALTTAAEDILLANGAPRDKVYLNRLGVDTAAVDRHRRAPRDGAKAPITIGYLGRFDPIKGVEDLLHAVQSLDRRLEFRVDIRGVGDDVDAKRVRAACESAARLDPRISVGGPVDRARVAEQLASWDVLCCPGLALEGGPTVALEALAVGTPVIGARFGGLAESITDHRNGRLFPPGDWRALADVIRSLVERPALLEEWRCHLPPVRSMRDVTTDYLAAYAGAL